jgi:RNA polymerase sigma factor (TIGR02999 family)
MERLDDAALHALLARAGSGDAGAASQLFELLYPDLRLIAGRIFRGQSGPHTLQPTAVLHEAYLKLFGAASRGAASFEDRSHFLNVAARAMRQVLVNHARDKQADKRGGDAVRVTLGEAMAAGGAGDAGVLEMDEALRALESLDERQARIVELRVFGGMTNPEIARAVGVSLRTVEKEWAMAKGWLQRRLGSSLEDRN